MSFHRLVLETMSYDAAIIAMDVRWQAWGLPQPSAVLGVTVVLGVAVVLRPARAMPVLAISRKRPAKQKNDIVMRFIFRPPRCT